MAHVEQIPIPTFIPISFAKYKYQMNVFLNGVFFWGVRLVNTK